jgi:hypothetical protein
MISSGCKFESDGPFQTPSMSFPETGLIASQKEIHSAFVWKSKKLASQDANFLFFTPNFNRSAG